MTALSYCVAGFLFILIRMGFFGAALRWVWEVKKAPPPQNMSCTSYNNDTLPKENSKICESRDSPTLFSFSSADIRIFTGNKQILLYQGTQI